MRLSHLLILLVTLSLNLITHSNAGTLIGDIYFSEQPVEEGNTSYGYYDGRALLRNSSDKTRTVTIALNNSRTKQFNVERTITIPPKAEVRVSLPVPPKSNGANRCFSVKVHETGKEKNDIWVKNNSSTHSLYDHSGQGYDFIVLTPLDPDMFLSKLKPKSGTASKSSYRHGAPVWDYSYAKKWDHGINNLSGIWQGLGRFDGIAIKNSELAKASATTKQTITEFILSGGTLMIFGTTSNPLPIHNTKVVDKSDDISIMAYGFGHLILITTDTTKDLEKKTSQRIVRLIEGHTFPVSHPQSSTIHKMLPVVPNVGIPLRSTFILMVIFSLLAGPVLIFVLSRKNRRIWLNWAIPALSIVTSVFLVVYALISEGVTSHVILSGITHLNQIDHMAATLGTHGYYTPFTPERGLEFNTASSLIKCSEYYWRDNSPSRTIDWTHGQNFTRGWISARVPEYFSCRTVERRRERIHFSQGSAPDKLNIINGLGADIESLTIVDHSGKIYKTSNLKAGVSIEITALAKPPRVSGKKLSTLLAENIWYAPTKPTTKIQLDPGTYLAEMNAAPFMNNGISYKKCQLKENSIIHGVWELANDS